MVYLKYDETTEAVSSATGNVTRLNQASESLNFVSTFPLCTYNQHTQVQLLLWTIHVSTRVVSGVGRREFTFQSTLKGDTESITRNTRKKTYRAIKPCISNYIYRILESEHNKMAHSDSCGHPHMSATTAAEELFFRGISLCNRWTKQALLAELQCHWLHLGAQCHPLHCLPHFFCLHKQS